MEERWLPLFFCALKILDELGTYTYGKELL